MNICKKDLAVFLKDVYNTYHHDFINYNYESLSRRISAHSIKAHIGSFKEYKKAVLENQKIFNDMFSFFSINVTEFFREPKQIKIFKNEVIPYLKSFSHLKIWCAGASSGESPYSLAIILHEEGLLDKTQIYATDFNNKILAKAKAGLFEIKDIQKSISNYTKSDGNDKFTNYFVKEGKYYKIKRFLKEKIVFFNHNLVTDGVMNEFQVIMCKNVLIYFDADLKNRVISLFDNSLDHNGFLVLGESEYLPDHFVNKFQHYSKNSKVYHKKWK